MVRQAAYAITVDGTDVSLRFHPILISLSITLYDGGQADTVALELDDTGGQIALPRLGARLSVMLGWSDEGVAPVFDGFTDEPKSHARPGHAARHEGGTASRIASTGSRSRGRVLTLTGQSANMGGKLKQPQEAHLDDKTFGDAAKEWGKAAGLSDVVVSGSLAQIQRPHWNIANESFMMWGMRMSRELGATFKIMGSKGVFTPRAGGQSASGQTLGGIRAAWGENLIDWSITPLQSRPSYAKFNSRFYDAKKAKWTIATEPGQASGLAGDSQPEHNARFKAAGQDIAQAQAKANAAESAREKGAADYVVIDGDPSAQPEAPCEVVGIRPGVNGSFTTSKVVHDLRRGAGWLTTCGLKQPSGGAGTDSRDTGASGGSSEAQQLADGTRAL